MYKNDNLYTVQIQQ